MNYEILFAIIVTAIFTGMITLPVVKQTVTRV